MARPFAMIQEESRRLSASEKEEVLHTLLEELDGRPDPHVESAWLKEVERRARELDSSQVQGIPAEEVFRQLDSLVS